MTLATTGLSPHMSWAMTLAASLSLTLHALLLWGLPESNASKPATAPPPAALQARLQPLPPTPLPELTLASPPPEAPPPDQMEPAAQAAKPARPTPRTRARPIAMAEAPLGDLPAPAAHAARQQLARLAAAEGFYPLEAIHQGWQGEVWVQIFLDAQGHVIAARVEHSSGYPSLDQAALRAARALRSLPTAGLEEAVLPVVFRLE